MFKLIFFKHELLIFAHEHPLSPPLSRFYNRKIQLKMINFPKKYLVVFRNMSIITTSRIKNTFQNSGSSNFSKILEQYLSKKLNMDVVSKIKSMVSADTNKYKFENISNFINILKGLDKHLGDLLRGYYEHRYVRTDISDFNHNKFRIICELFMILMNKFDNYKKYIPISVGKTRPYFIFAISNKSTSIINNYIVLRYQVSPFDPDDITIKITRCLTIEMARREIKKWEKITIDSVSQSFSPGKSPN